MTVRILVVDDEESVRAMLGLVLKHAGYDIIEAADGYTALTIVEQSPPDVILLDVRMPGMDGMAVFRALRQQNITSPVIFMTAFAAVDSAVEAMRAGAYDYIIKPFNIEEAKIIIRRAVDSQQLAQEANHLRQELSAHFRLNRMLTYSPKMKLVYDRVAKVAPTQATVLITGESGTGKELLVNTIHYNSPRASAPLIKVNCSALPEALLESELFGHEKGAFTSAAAKRIGRFEMADKGTLFLDEIGEMSLPLQVKLLRVLQEREFERVGGCQTLKTDIRVIAATNRSLPEMVARGEFREDLYYRLAVVTLDIPPLRDRREDIPLIARLFLQKFAQETGREVDGFDHEALALLQNYEWPGNVRELSNIVERAVIMSTGRLLFVEDLAPCLGACPLRTGTELSAWRGKSLREIIKETEYNVIRQALRLNKGNRVKTARDLDMSRRSLQYKIEEYGLTEEGSY